LGKVAMLLPTDFDAANCRKHLFGGRPFKVKLVLRRRIRWANLEQKHNGPSGNHAWFVFDWSQAEDKTAGMAEHIQELEAAREEIMTLAGAREAYRTQLLKLSADDRQSELAALAADLAA
jgi:hypothetical protein